MKIWHASLDTSSFRFDAYGATEKDARAALTKGLKAHAKHYRIAPDWFRDYDDAINCQEVELGKAYRYGDDSAL